MRGLTRDIARLLRMGHQARAAEFGVVHPRRLPTLSRPTAPRTTATADTPSDRDATT
jgi:hypothetical protein